jgi:predicted GNAT superfamily acetyltransferase
MATSTEVPEAVLGQARRVAAAAARRAGVELRDLHDLPELRSAVDLFDRTWASDNGSYMPLNLLRALSHAGCHVSAAVAEDGRMVGAVVAFLGIQEGRTALHSHLLTVVPDARGRNIGCALKLHQRAWSLERGIDLVTWTFDPLMGRNAYLNLTRLGARVAEYLPDFYGEMADSINAADESDRMLAAWWLADERTLAATAAAASGDRTAGAGSGLGDVVVEVGLDDVPVARESAAEVLLCCIPGDIEAIRRRDVELALRWRRSLRRAILDALDRGYRVDGFLREGCYLLRRSRP